jgi:serine protein kinase
MATDTSSATFVSKIAALQDYKQYEDLHWEGSFEDYIRVVRDRPEITRNAFQRLYDMIISYGEEEYIDNKKRLVRYPFFRDPMENGRDAIHGLDIPLMRLVHVLQAASQGYGPEKRIILLHGPVGSSKSTMARLLKKGIEHYSRTSAGCLYTFKWVNSPARCTKSRCASCPKSGVRR